MNFSATPTFSSAHSTQFGHAADSTRKNSSCCRNQPVFTGQRMTAVSASQKPKFGAIATIACCGVAGLGLAGVLALALKGIAVLWGALVALPAVLSAVF